MGALTSMGSLRSILRPTLDAESLALSVREGQAQH
jgi:hypothetical protein